ncbi:MAG TPA: DUF1028 domain-containing protein [Bacillota bacterium]|nr:DUF1028 domain-containing protein [Bacillota bacterium]
MTFSIIGYDPETEELGIAVQSKFLGVGAVVPWAKAGVGAVATQSYANPAYGPDGLALMEQGKTAEEALKTLVEADEGRSLRQAGMMDAKGGAATYTGEDCYDWAGGRIGENCVAQGNILVSGATVDAMVDTFEQTEGDLADRLLVALDAGQGAGGDKRGMQSAAIYVVKEKGGYLEANDRYVDLRVDEHPDPIKELIRIYKLQQLYFAGPKEEDVLTVEGEVKQQIASQLQALGQLETTEVDDDTFYEALTSFIRTENFERRELERGKIDRAILEYMTEKATSNT